MRNVGSYVVGNRLPIRMVIGVWTQTWGAAKKVEKRLRAAEGSLRGSSSLLLVMLLKSKCDPAQLAWKAVLGLPLLWPADTALVEEGVLP